MDKYYIGFIVLVILCSSIYIMIPDSVRIDVQGTKSIFKVWEDERWVTSGIEWVKI